MVETIPREGVTRDWSIVDYIGRGQCLSVLIAKLFRQSIQPKSHQRYLLSTGKGWKTGKVKRPGTLQLRRQRLMILLWSWLKTIAFLSSALRPAGRGDFWVLNWSWKWFLNHLQMLIFKSMMAALFSLQITIAFLQSSITYHSFLPSLSAILTKISCDTFSCFKKWIRSTQY